MNDLLVLMKSKPVTTDQIELEQIGRVVCDIGTRTYTRQDYAIQITEGRLNNPSIYHCYHMCRDCASALQEHGFKAWSVMGYGDNNGLKQLHPIVITEYGDRQYTLFDPAFGILEPLQLDGQTRTTTNGKFTVIPDGNTIQLHNSASQKSFVYEFSPDQESFKTSDELMVRRNNFPGDSYSMTYRYDPTGAVVANISFFHTDKDDPQHGMMMIMRRNPDGVLESRRFSHSEVTQSNRTFNIWLEEACCALGSPFETVRAGFLVLINRTADLREAQRVERRKELERQISGIPLW